MNRLVPIAVAGVVGFGLGGGVGMTIADDADEVDRLEGELAVLEEAEAAAAAEEASSPDLRYEATLHGLGGFIEDGDEESVSLNFPFTPDDQLHGLLDDLGFNATAVMQRIGNTRALDGTLTADGDGVSATWTYHPDDGLSLVIEATG